MIPSVNSTISALQAYKTRLGVTADNVANVNTDEFKKIRTAWASADGIEQSSQHLVLGLQHFQIGFIGSLGDHH